MLNLSDLEKSGVVFKKFCGLDAEEGVGCSEEAVGEIIAQLPDGPQIPIPVCQGHLEMIQSEYDVDNLSLG